MIGRTREERVVTSIALSVNQEPPVPQQPPPPPFWKQPAIWVSAALTPLVYIVVIMVLQGSYSTEVKVMVIAAVLAALAAITGFWLSTSYSSSKKDDAIIGNAAGPTTINTPGPATTTINQGKP